MSTQNFQENNDHAPAESEAPPSRPESPENSENFEPEIDIEEENSGALYHRGLKAVSVAEYMYKIRDDSNNYEFLGTDTEEGIEKILMDRQGHSLHEIIDGDDPLRPFIDFDLSREAFDKIEPKLTPKEIKNTLYNAFTKTCLDVFPEWDKT